jgi:phosphoribosylamine-glycine ligase
MNIVILSNTASYHQLAKHLEKEKTVDNIYHYGSNKANIPTNKYHPCTQEFNVNNLKGIDFVLASGIDVLQTGLQDDLNKRNISYLLPTKELATLETHKQVTKLILEKLNIPTAKGYRTTGKELFNTFKKIPRPFVLKVLKYMHGRQTVIVTDENVHSVYSELFSELSASAPNVGNITKDTVVVIEEYLHIEREYSYHAIVNYQGWEYLGSARDYKNRFDGDIGVLGDSAGSYTVTDIDYRVHDYTNKIVSYLIKKGYPYKGFLFLGIAVVGGIPYVLEINTRSGDTELQTIISTIDNNLSELLFAASKDFSIPKVIHNNKKAVSIAVLNRTDDWTKEASYMPNFDQVPDDILSGIEGTDKFFSRHSCFTAIADNCEQASRRLYNYLDSKTVGQFYYRRDIGILK